MRRWLGMAMACAAMAAGSAGADEAYPTRPISMVVAFPPGGLADNTARPVATALERILKQPVAIVNKARAAGAVGNQFGTKVLPPSTSRWPGWRQL
jgi:tripartite-type tricarboxylate transporter receptor subunit TctC